MGYTSFDGCRISLSKSSSPEPAAGPLISSKFCDSVSTGRRGGSILSGAVKDATGAGTGWRCGIRSQSSLSANNSGLPTPGREGLVTELERPRMEGARLPAPSDDVIKPSDDSCGPSCDASCDCDNGNETPNGVVGTGVNWDNGRRVASCSSCIDSIDAICAS